MDAAQAVSAGASGLAPALRAETFGARLGTAVTECGIEASATAPHQASRRAQPVAAVEIAPADVDNPGCHRLGRGRAGRATNPRRASNKNAPFQPPLQRAHRRALTARQTTNRCRRLAEF